MSFFRPSNKQLHTINLTDLRKILWHWVKYVDHSGDRLMIFNRGAPYAALISYGDYQRLKMLEGRNIEHMRRKLFVDHVLWARVQKLLEE